MRLDTTAFGMICPILAYSVGVIAGIVAGRLEHRPSSDASSKT